MLVVTPNLCFDRTLWVERFEAGTVSRPHGVSVTAGGKGVNVVRTLRCLGVQATIVGLLPAVDGERLGQLLAEEGARLVAVPIAGAVRVATVIVESSGRATVLNEPGPTTGRAERDALLDAVGATLDTESDRAVVACSGSLPPGLSDDTYGRVADLVHEHGGVVVVDAARAALEAALPFGPDVVTPNLDEARMVLDGSTEELSHQGEDVAAEQRAAFVAGHGLRERGALRAVVTVGAHGAAFVDVDGAEHWVPAHRVDAVNPIGAGDSFVGGLGHALGEGRDWTDSLRHAVAVAGAAVEEPIAGRLDPARVAELERRVVEQVRP